MLGGTIALCAGNGFIDNSSVRQIVGVVVRLLFDTSELNRRTRTLTVRMKTIHFFSQLSAHSSQHESPYDKQFSFCLHFRV